MTLHRSHRPDLLVDGLARLLRDEPAGVFEQEVVVVPERGVERWLTQQLSHHLGTGSAQGQDGVCAGLRVLRPASLVGLLLGRDIDDPWHAERLSWSVLRAVDTAVSSGDPVFEPLVQHLGADATDPFERQVRQSRRYSVARRLAGIFASCARERPAALAQWEAGQDGDGAGGALADDLLWQPPLWRLVVADVVESGLASESPVQRHARVVQELAGGTLEIDLPARISLFGHTRLAATDVELLRALGTHREVHLWLPHPSPALWDALAPAAHGAVARVQDDSAALAEHPLLATLGRDVRELQRGFGVVESEVLGADAPAGTSRLSRLQADVRANARPSNEPAVPDDDTSIQVHACHGPARQVEVLREVLLSLFADDPTLEPRDVIVMCPDVESFAPLIQSAFAARGVVDAVGERTHPGQAIPVRLADRAAAAANPLIELARQVLGLVAGRLTASEVLDLAARPEVALRFGFDEKDLELITRWVADAGVRWGLDARHRGEYGLEIDANTWRRGLDRLALGAVAAEDAHSEIGAMVPIDDVSSNSVEVAGRLIELLERLGRALTQVHTADAFSAQDWMDWLGRTVDDLAAPPLDEPWQRAQLQRELAEIRESAGADVTLRLPDVTTLLDRRWAARPGRANFRSGAVTVCTMVPMRTVPHRVVVVLGVDDGSYPRNPDTDGDNPLGREPMTGERDPRSEDRQLMLDALMAASDTFVAVYSGYDERTGDTRPPAVPVQDVVSAAAATGRVARPGEEIADAPFVRHHPLQAYDDRNFTTSSPVPGGSFDATARDGALALRARRAEGEVEPAPFIEDLLPMPDDDAIDSVTLDDLVKFFEHPGREFLRHRLDISVPREVEEPDDHLPIELDGLGQWAIGERMVQAARSGASVQEAVAAEEKRGSIPPGALGESLREQLPRNVAEIVREHRDEALRSVTVRADLPIAVRGRETPLTVRLTGTVPHVGDGVMHVVTYSRIKAKHIIAAWVRLLALAVSDPSRPYRAHLRGKQTDVTLTAPRQDVAEQTLASLVADRISGLRFPLGVPPGTAKDFARSHLRSSKPEPERTFAAYEAARGTWEGDWLRGRSGIFIEGEREDLWWTYLYGPHSSIERLDEPTRLKTLTAWAPRIWKPIFEAGAPL